MDHKRSSATHSSNAQKSSSKLSPDDSADNNGKLGNNKWQKALTVIKDKKGFFKKKPTKEVDEAEEIDPVYLLLKSAAQQAQQQPEHMASSTSNSNLSHDQINRPPSSRSHNK